jgi:peroxiredoxin
MKTVLCVALFSILVSCGSNKDGFKITVLNSTLSDSTKVYLRENETSKIWDSTIVINNQFIFKGRVDSIKMLTIHTKNFSDYKMFWVDNSDIQIDAAHSRLKNSHISGSHFQNQNSEYIDLENLWRNKKDSIDQIIRMADKADSISYKNLLQTRDSITINQQNEILKFMKSNKDFRLNSYYLSFLMYYQPKQATERMYNAISEDIKKDKWGKAVKVYIDKSTNLMIGDNIIDFTLPDINGNLISLSSFHGKYVLLEFWASWCGPCKGEIPNLLKMYRKYKKDGFEILGVSLDEHKEDWQSIIKSDTLIWKTVSDLKGNLGEVVLTYNVIGIPMNYLIDPEGKIVDIDLRDDSLGNRLSKIFNH